MHLLKSLAVISSLVILFPACEKRTDSATPNSTASKNYLKVTFDGKTKVYTDVRLAEGKLGSIVSLDINAGSSASDYLTISVFGQKTGLYPYRNDLNKYTQVSQVEYRTGGNIFENYKALVCPNESGYYSTQGQVNVDEYVAGKLAKGSFSGALLDRNGDDCSKESKGFSGELYVVSVQ